MVRRSSGTRRGWASCSLCPRMLSIARFVSSTVAVIRGRKSSSWPRVNFLKVASCEYKRYVSILSVEFYKLGPLCISDSVS